ncbi:MAG: 50S ribosomal protein L14e [Nanoarchaeota archaeon]
MVIEIGRVCVKLAGRDSNKRCVIVDVVDEHTVLIDGQTRRRKCNVRHLEPLDQVLKLKKGADHAAVKAVFEKEGWSVVDTKPKVAAPRPTKVRRAKKASPVEPAPIKKSVKKAKTA